MQKKENIFRDNECHLLLEPEEKKKTLPNLNKDPANIVGRKWQVKKRKKLFV